MSGAWSHLPVSLLLFFDFERIALLEDYSEAVQQIGVLVVDSTTYRKV